MPAIRPNWRSNGVATDDAMVSGLAPGRPAPTEMTGNSTCGKGATGRNRKASAPDKNRAMVRSVVPIGRRINGAEIFMANPRWPSAQWDFRFGTVKTFDRADQKRD